MHCGMFCKKDKFARNHEEVHADGLTRCARPRRRPHAQVAARARGARRDARPTRRRGAHRGPRRAARPARPTWTCASSSASSSRSGPRPTRRRARRRRRRVPGALQPAHAGAPRRAPERLGDPHGGDRGGRGGAARARGGRGGGLSVTNTQAAPPARRGRAAAASDSAGGERTPRRRCHPSARAPARGRNLPLPAHARRHAAYVSEHPEKGRVRSRLLSHHGLSRLPSSRRALRKSGWLCRAGQGGSPPGVEAQPAGRRGTRGIRAPASVCTSTRKGCS